MNSLKRHAWPGVLVLVCIMTGLIAVLPIPVMNGQAFADTGPDLTIASISWSPEGPSIRDTVAFTTTISNLGDSPAFQPRIDYFIDDILVGSALLDTIISGGFITNTMTWQAPAGDHIIRAIIDKDDNIAETNEDNNEKIYAFSVIAPDLIIESITWSPQIASLGNSVTFTIKLKNRGNKSAGIGCLEFFIDGASRGQQEYSQLEPGESITKSYSWITQAGNHAITATADVFGQCIESDETNNSLSVIYSTATPDLIIDSISWSPTNRVDTENITIHVTVKNKGTGIANPSWLNFYINDVFCTTADIGSLDAGASVTKTCSWFAWPDEQILKAVIDPDNWIYESDESNNSKSITMPAVAPPDLVVQSITWTPSQPTINSIITYTVTVKNTGGKTVDTCSLDFYADVTYKINRKLGPITPGGTASVDMLCFISTLPVKVVAIIDPENFVAESDETNNTTQASFTPSAPTSTFDFYVTSLTYTPSNPVAGQEVIITAKIKNNGSSQAPESWLACYVDDTMIQTTLIKCLNAKNSEIENIVWIATPGIHTIKVVADYNNSLLEIYESNNSKEIALTTLSADLAVKGIAWSPEIPEKGDVFSITFSITNSGTYKSNGCYVRYYVDGSYAGNHYIDEILPGGTVTRTLPWTLTNDFQTFKVTIDEENSVIESNESNNEKTAVIPAPDLIIEWITCSPAEFTANSTVTFTIAVKNIGVTLAESPFLDCYINNVFQERLPVTPIAAGTYAEVLFEWTALPGDNYLKVILDSDDNIVEVNETNNEMSINFKATAPVAEPNSSNNENVGEATENATANEAQAIPAMILDTNELPPDQGSKIPSNIPVDTNNDLSATSGGDLPLWQNIFGNFWIIIAVAVVGLAAISVLLVLRKRSQAYKVM